MRYLVPFVFIWLASDAWGHEAERHTTIKDSTVSAAVTYLGNTGLMVSQGEQQILFDPFFHNHYNQYQLVPEDIRTAIFTDQAPYDSIEMILISHAHGDHFDANDVVDYLQQHAKTQLIAPTQAVEQLQAISDFEQVQKQISGISLVYGEAPVTLDFKAIKVEAVRIPHAGWPGRADVSNLVYRVTLNDAVTVMHMGDADPNDLHFKPWAEHWQKQVTDGAFPPYWFLTNQAGKNILTERINAKQYTGVHVPVSVPIHLQSSGESYFSEPGSSLELIAPVEQSSAEQPPTHQSDHHE